jgi:signal transduction histidine kinase
MARLVADLPTVRAAVDTDDPPTVQPIAVESRNQIKVDVLVLSDHAGRVLAAVGGDAGALPPATRAASMDDVSAFLPNPHGLLQIVSVPIVAIPPITGDVRDCLGRVTVGFFLDDRRAAQFKAQTGSEVAFSADGRILASTLPHSVNAALASVVTRLDIATVRLGSDEYMALSHPLAQAARGSAPSAVLVLRSRTDRLRFLNTVRAGIVAAFVVTILLATVLSFAVARTVTRPLAAVTGAMREVAATGDLTRKVVLRSRPWDDEDARLLATAFNTLTDSIARFQREAAQKERLSSLGRLSTVIAHEIRNPLMIIRATLTTLTRPGVTPAEVAEAVADIDEETTRLKRIVTEVLDFARPVRFELSETDVNDLCRASAAAAWAGEPLDVRFELDPAVPPMLTDAERLRTALVNILTNARHALGLRRRAAQADGALAVATGSPGVIVRTTLHGDRVGISIIDQGTGIALEDMAHIFDPYFTTRRAGTGLGLPIAKNIVEGLDGTIAVTSRQGRGTEIHIDLPLRPEHAA